MREPEFDMSPEEIYGPACVPQCCLPKWSAAAEREMRMYGEWVDPNDPPDDEEDEEDYDDEEEEE